ncbi:hypothetical protein BpHYR1_009064 [Brachionus plicatilis]|uniref:Uncharacterized protein n=1 Tax=Brachionus plicatilis TaxID=10195 RepID=A0A3M7QMS0_BRAPC|nr:hypothetical protein BpHYR1_009064 [Brachionus plicatilis]
MNKELIEFSDQIRDFVSECDLVTKSTIHSINSLNTDIERQETRIHDFLNRINSKKQFNENLGRAIHELDAFLTLCDTIENDKLNIRSGPKGSVAEYIKKLDYLKSVDKYPWYKELKLTRNKKNEPNIQVSFAKHEELIRKGENFICFEFQNILKHNCNREQMKYFIEFLMEKFDLNKPSETFVPNTTIRKLELICSWFLQRELMYELYDDKNPYKN